MIIGVKELYMTLFYKWVCSLFCLGLLFTAQAQQDPNITNYLFNGLGFNPAFAGKTDYLSATFIYRSQWWGWSEDFSELPTTTIINVQAPVQKRVGLGLSLMRDRIGVTTNTSANFAFAYKIDINKTTRLSASLQVGLVSWNANWNQLTFRDRQADDPVFNNGNISRTLPNFGAGLYFETKHYYIGFSLPRMVNFDLREVGEYESDLLASSQLYRHVYFTAGGNVPILSQDIVYKPSILFRRVGTFGRAKQLTDSPSTPTALDIGNSILLLEKLWLGLVYRTSLEGAFSSRSSHDSVDFWAAWYTGTGLRIGVGYDIPINSIRQYASGSMEIMVGYDFNYKVSKVPNPRYFPF